MLQIAGNTVCSRGNISTGYCRFPHSPLKNQRVAAKSDTNTVTDSFYGTEVSLPFFSLFRCWIFWYPTIRHPRLIPCYHTVHSWYLTALCSGLHPTASFFLAGTLLLPLFSSWHPAADDCYVSKNLSHATYHIHPLAWINCSHSFGRISSLCLLGIFIASSA
jgi:hypothetical protein